MFEDVARQHRRKGRGSSMTVSLALHGAAVAGLALLGGAGARLGPPVIDAVRVELRAPPAPPPPPPPAAHRAPKAARPAPRVRSGMPKLLIQPTEAPRPVEPPPPPEQPAEEEDDDGDEGGVEGGVPGGVVGGIGPAPAIAPEPLPPPRPALFSQAMTAPKLLSGPNPEYTPEAKAQGIEGLMAVKCVITVEGEVRQCRVVKGLPFMDAAVIRAFEQRRYTPALHDGRPIEVEYLFTLRLRLER